VQMHVFSIGVFTQLLDYCPGFDRLVAQPFRKSWCCFSLKWSRTVQKDLFHAGGGKWVLTLTVVISEC